MPDPDDTPQRSGRPLLTGLFWIGVGIAPIAAGLLLLGQSDKALRIAAALAVLCVVLVGLSIALRGDAETVRQDLEETLFDEVESLHKDVRNDIATAARATHKAFGEKLQVLQHEVAALRGQLDAARAGLAHAGSATAMAARAAPRGSASHGRESAGFEPGEAVGRLTANPGRDGPYPDPTSPRPNTSRRRPSPGRQEPSVRTGEVRFGDRAAGPPAGAVPPHLTGVVRRTETVQVTTRRTIVGPPGDASGAGYGDGDGGYGRSGDWTAPPQAAAAPGRGGRTDDPRERSWTVQRLRDQGVGEVARVPQYQADGEEGWSDLRAGDRWASVRADERGREVRMGERRAAVRADETGTELRITDRWAAVRQDDGWAGEPRRDGDRWSDDRAWRAHRPVDDPGRDREPDGLDSSGRWSVDRGWDDADRGRPALPSGGTDSSGSGSEYSSGSWSQGWREPDREPVGRGSGHRDEGEYGYPSPDTPRASGARRLDFGPADDRWQ